MIRLHNVDAIQFLRQTMPGSFDMACTDPPYRTISGGSNEGKGGGWDRPGGILNKNDGRIFKHNDVEPEDYMQLLFNSLKSPGHAYVFTNELNRRRTEDAMISAGFVIHGLLTWKKQNATPSRWYMSNSEFVFFGRKGPAKAINNCGSKRVHEFNNPFGNKRHPTEKPVDLIRMYVENSTQPGETVFDPFFGAGATPVACQESGRSFVGCELDPLYYGRTCGRLGIMP